MELLTHRKNDYLLDASFDTLHGESKDWLKELEFWSDEMAFFYKLLHKKGPGEAFPAKDLAAIEKALIRINGEVLDRVRTGVLSHERLLSSILKSTSMTEEHVYRETHRRLHAEMYNLNALIRSFKKDVFEFYSE
ncbi:MAG: hypothetical protein WEB30_15275 [Cyclobacteriaceae bacterium]